MRGCVPRGSDSSHDTSRVERLLDRRALTTARADEQLTGGAVVIQPKALAFGTLVCVCRVPAGSIVTHADTRERSLQKGNIALADLRATTPLRNEMLSGVTNWIDNTHLGDCREVLKRMIADRVRVQTCITSPPYWQLRDYGVAGQIGLESTPSDYVATLVEVFRLVRQILAPDGTLWLNLGDCYASSGEPGHNLLGQFSERWAGGGHKYSALDKPYRSLAQGLKPKDLVGLPWRVAFALQEDGWYLRSDIIEEVEFYCPCGCGHVLEERIWRWSQDRDLVWKKPNPLPESVRDRPTRSHEYLFLFSRSKHYYFDIDAIKEPAVYGAPNSPASIASPYGQGYTRRARTIGIGKSARPRKAVPNVSATRKTLRSTTEHRHRAVIGGGQSIQAHPNSVRHKRSVWTVATTPFSGAHFATFPRKLIEPCILAGSRPGDVVLDPFMGAGTVAIVAQHLGRRFIGCELNPAYIDMHGLRRRSLRLQ